SYQQLPLRFVSTRQNLNFISKDVYTGDANSAWVRSCPHNYTRDNILAFDPGGKGANNQPAKSKDTRLDHCYTIDSTNQPSSIKCSSCPRGAIPKNYQQRSLQLQQS